MKLSTTAYIVGALASTAAAFPSMQKEWDEAHLLDKRQSPPGFPYEPNPPGCVRAPCPGCNTLSNHGYINRQGLGISAAELQNGFLEAFGMGLEATQAGATNAINLCSQQTGKTCTTFNLDMLNQPHAIEHDGSLSRRDKEMFHDINANNHEFNQTIWDRTLDVYGASPHIGIKFANTARLVRVAEAQEADFPGWFIENAGGSLAEHAFTLSTMNDPALGVNLATPGANPQARVDWINFWLTRQQLPIPLGWQRPSQTITLNQLTSLEAAIQAAPTVTINPGVSPFLAKRDLISSPQPSYDIGLAERAEPVPLAAAPTLVSNPEYSARVQEAVASATALAGPAPVIPNPYFTIISPEEFASLDEQVATYRSTVQSHFSRILADLGVPAKK